MATLIKTDKNGTKYWFERKCPKCGGTGYIDCYAYIEGGRCFHCGGTGEHPYSWKEYTPEYAAKLEERRIAREKKKAPDKNAKILKHNGFNEEGFMWIVLGNTFEIKEDLKAAGAKFNDTFLWHFDHEPEKFSTIRISIEDVAVKTAFDTWLIDNYEAVNYIKDLLKTNAPKTESQYIGNIGDKVDLKVTLVKIRTYETHYSYYGELNFIYQFSDENGNTIIWKTGGKNLEQGKTYQIKGKIKEHNEYKGDKQTILTRCKISE